MNGLYAKTTGYSHLYRWMPFVASVVFCLALAACNRQKVSGGPAYSDKPVTAQVETRYVFAVHPLQNPQLLHQMYQPLMAYLGRQLGGAEVVLDTSNDYADFERKLKDGIPQFALPNPYHATLARNWGYQVVAKMGNDEVFRGIFIVRNDSPVKKPEDLKGLVVSYPAPTALAAAMLPQLYLQNHGVDVEKDITNKYVGTHNSSIMNAYLGEAAAAATWPVAWNAFQKANPKEASQLHVIWQTPQLIQNAVIAQHTVPAAVREKVQSLLVELTQHSEGQQLLAGIDTASFVRASDQDFDVVSTFLEEFNVKVRKQK